MGASSRNGNLLTHTIGSDFFIDKLPTIIGIEAQDRKREERSGALESCQHCLSPAVEQGKTFCPAGGDIGQRDRVQATTL
jgi:epoxyqueuosine reductase QueG